MYFRTVASAATLLLTNVGSFASAQSIYDLANQTDALSTLKAAVDAAGLTDALSGNGTFTVFAPTNDAFGKIDTETVTKLLKPEWSHHLEDILLYHVLPSVVISSELVDGSVETLNGESITIDATALTINNSSGIVVGSIDIQADNGVVRKYNFLLSKLFSTVDHC
jgi:uncharacterized surface protein with fasciclin (FAS1) repeats